MQWIKSNLFQLVQELQNLQLETACLLSVPQEAPVNCKIYDMTTK